MDFKKILLIAGILMIFFSCYFYMNRNFDPLARYPYANEKVSKAMSKLTSREISYVVDYDIHPEAFMAYIEANNFNIYHISDYNNVRHYFAYLSDHQIVDITERLLKVNKNYDAFCEANRWKMHAELVELIDKGF